jgi:hypothetical protein
VRLVDPESLWLLPKALMLKLVALLRVPETALKKVVVLVLDSIVGPGRQLVNPLSTCVLDAYLEL